MTEDEGTGKCQLCLDPTSELRISRAYRSVILEMIKVFWEKGNLGAVPSWVVTPDPGGYCLCKECKLTLMEVHKTESEILDVRNEIESVIGEMAVKIMESEKDLENYAAAVKEEANEGGTWSSDGIEGKGSSMEDILDENGREFRRMILQRFNPSVRLRKLILSPDLTPTSDTAISVLSARDGPAEEDIVVCTHSYGVATMSREAVSTLKEHKHQSSIITTGRNKSSNSKKSVVDLKEKEWKCGFCHSQFGSSDEFWNHLEERRKNKGSCGKEASACDDSSEAHEIVQDGDGENIVVKTVPEREGGTAMNSTPKTKRSATVKISSQKSATPKTQRKSARKWFKCTYAGCCKSYTQKQILNDHIAASHKKRPSNRNEDSDDEVMIID